ncbi:MAG TPA: gliding motility-associated C-terminal domain-containing protein, partial [Saprospiraceae bacterium]
PLQVCAGSDFAVSFNGDASLDQDDLFGFVLHDNAGTQLGTIYAMSPDTTFTFPQGIVLGQTYYVSPLAGSNNGSGSIDFSDPCLSVAQGIPVIFYQPQVAISSGDVICQDECITYTLELSGEGPFELAYRVNANGIWTDHVLITDTNFVSLVICPQDYILTNGTLDIIPLTLADARCTVTLSPLPGTQTSILSSSESFIAEVLCPGESVLVNGIRYDQSNPEGTQVVPNAAGCDSTIHINLSFYPTVIFELNQSLCFGGSIVVNSTVYNESNPQGTEILPGESINSCDSVINIQLTFDTIVTADFTPTLCSGESIVINGNIYDEYNPSGTALFPNGSALGCDSILNIELNFNPHATSSLDLILCNDETIIVNGTIYDISHPSGIEVLPDASYLGCDSSIHINLGFYPEAVGYITDTLTAGDSLLIQGTLYHQHHPTGTEIIPGGSITGCDSIIEIALFFRPAMAVRIETIAPDCYGEASGEIVLEEIIEGQSPYLIFIDGGNQISVSDFPVVLSGLYSGIHQLIITDATSTELLFEVDVPEATLLLVNAGDDQIILHGEDSHFEANASFQVVTWLWEPGDFLSCVDCPNPQILKPDQNITYTVVATDQYGCQASDEIALSIQYEVGIYIPNVFSPNGDGVNDTWRIFSSDQEASLVSLSILDRWGGILYQCADKPLNDSGVAWDGSMKGKEVGSGVYVFVAVVKTNDGVNRQMKGDITLIR